jgi:hypothetical protein
MSRLKAKSKEPSVRITDWVMFYSFDIIGDVGFGRSFGMVEKGEEDDIIKLLHAGQWPLYEVYVRQMLTLYILVCRHGAFQYIWPYHVGTQLSNTDISWREGIA